MPTIPLGEEDSEEKSKFTNDEDSGSEAEFYNSYNYMVGPSVARALV